MNSRFLSILVRVLGIVFVLPMLLAASRDPEPDLIDLKLEGYPQRVTLPSSSSALMWMLLFLLTMICVAVLFKNAKRSHLD